MNDNAFQEREIDLIDILWRLVEQWRGILVISVICAVMVLSIALLKKVSMPVAEENAVTEDAVDESSEGTANEGLSELEDIQLIDVDAEYQQACTALSQYVTYSIQRDSYSNTILSKYDFTDCKFITVIYEFVLTGDSRDLFVVNNVYASMMDNGDFTTNLAKAFAKDESTDIDSNSISDLVTVSVSSNSNDAQSNRGTIIIRATLPQDIEDELWKTSLNTAIQKYHNDVANVVCAHSLNRIAVNKKNLDGKSQTSSQNTRLTDIAAAKNAFEATLKSLNQPTQDLIENIIKTHDGDYKYNSFKEYLDDGWEQNLVELNQLNELNKIELQAQQEITAGADSVEEKSDSVNDEKQLESKSDNKFLQKMMLGFVVGIMLYACVYMAWYIFVGVIKREDEVSELTGIRCFGGIYQYPYKTKLNVFLHDERIYKIRQKHGRNASEITEDLLVKLEYSHIDNITIMLAGMTNNKSDAIISEQLSCLKGKDIKVNLLNNEDISQNFGDSIFYNMQTVYLVLIGNMTKYNDLQRIFAISVIGYEFLWAE